MNATPFVSVIIPVWNGRPYLQRALTALLAQRTTNDQTFEVIAVDNASTDDSANFIATNFPTVRLLRNRTNQGFAGGCNRGLEAAQGSLCVVLNQDTLVRPGWINELIMAAADPQIGIVGCKILYPDGVTLQHTGGWLEWPLGLAHHTGAGEIDHGQWDTPRTVEFVTGAALAIRREVLTQVGAFDEAFWPGYFEDVDLCLRVQRAGWRIYYAPTAVLEHQESTTVRDPALRTYYYHCGRLRLLLKHLLPDRWRSEFVPAELTALPQFVRGQDGFALQLAYSTLILTAASSLLKAWRVDMETITQTIDALRLLYDQANVETTRIHAERLASTTPEWSAHIAANSTMLRVLPLTEHHFESHHHIFGLFIGAFRRFWYNIAARWGDHYLRLQQDSINSGLDMELTLHRQQIDLLIAENARLAAKLAYLEQSKAPIDSA
ncbi:MAG TPA: hypothetical protein DCL15_04890 [Chloroflexi bacterium]|nr:hypothetical protein [Chloroflexota bacterium]HHW88216.1 glycosyltransferase family 2 protein [Chloroflexota bacterium]